MKTFFRALMGKDVVARTKILLQNPLVGIGTVAWALSIVVFYIAFFVLPLEVKVGEMTPITVTQVVIIPEITREPIPTEEIATAIPTVIEPPTDDGSIEMPAPYCWNNKVVVWGDTYYVAHPGMYLSNSEAQEWYYSFFLEELGYVPNDIRPLAGVDGSTDSVGSYYIDAWEGQIYINHIPCK